MKAPEGKDHISDFFHSVNDALSQTKRKPCPADFVSQSGHQAGRHTTTHSALKLANFQSAHVTRPIPSRGFLKCLDIRHKGVCLVLYSCFRLFLF
jgi:hypothetical protein